MAVSTGGRFAPEGQRLEGPAELGFDWKSPGPKLCPFIAPGATLGGSEEEGVAAGERQVGTEASVL